MKHHNHGDTGTRLYRIWKSMKCRCLNSNHPSYKNYGGRGITICKEWVENYQTFKDWCLTHGYAENLELDRVNVNEGYCPENCQWISHFDQTMNRRDTLYIVINGHAEKIRDFCKANGINIHTFTNWRYLGIETQKMSERLGVPVVIGQRREVIGV